MGWTIGGTLGIVLGGIITSLTTWRFIFYINVPIGLIGFYLALKFIKDNQEEKVKMDYSGTGLLLVLLVLISYGAVEIAGNGVSALNLAMLVAGIVLIIPFLVVEKVVKSPMLILRAFKEKMLSYSLLSATLQAIGYLSVLFILIMYLQGVRGYSPLDSALLLVPGYIVSSLLSPRMGRLSDKISPGYVASTGIFLMAIGVLIYYSMGVATPIYIVVVGSLATGIGGSFFWPSNSSAVMTAAPRDLLGSVSGLQRTLSNIGTLMSYVIAISIAALSVPRNVAFEVFLGVDKLQGGVSAKFMVGIHSALLVSFIILIFGALSSLATGKMRRFNPHTPDKVSEPEKV
jgi:MFS family permease